MFKPNQRVLVLASVGRRKPRWFRGVIVESRTPMCNHRISAFSGHDPYEDDCLVCFFLGKQPRYDVAVVHDGKKYFAKNVSPGNLRTT